MKSSPTIAEGVKPNRKQLNEVEFDKYTTFTPWLHHKKAPDKKAEDCIWKWSVQDQ